MKKVIYIIILTSLTLFFSCQDLDQDPQSTLSYEQYFAGGAKPAELLSEGLGVTMWDGNYGFNCRQQRINLGADGVTSLKSSAMEFFIDLNPQIASNDADLAPIWKACYRVIYDANLIINMGQVMVGLTDANGIKAEEDRLKVAKGEAHFMRALSYFYLIRLFGKCPLTLNHTDATDAMPLSSPEEIYTKAILPSLKIAEVDLPNKSRTFVNKTKAGSALPSKWAAKALLADVYITMAEWPLKKGNEYYTLAETTAGEVIDNATTAELMLTPKYENLWKESLKKDVNEHLFALHHSVSGKNPSQYGKSYYGADYYPNAGWSDYFANIDFFKIYPDDERKEWNYLTEWLVKQKDESIKLTQYPETIDKTPLIAKFMDYDDGDHGKNALSNGLTPIYRYADVLLTYAEASVKAKGTVSQKALTALNDVQRRAAKKLADGTIDPAAIITTSTDPVVFEKAVFDEHGWEFLGEPRRWYQLVRTEKLKDVKPVQWENSIFKKNNHYYMPIPNEQITLTGWTNNPGY